MKSKVKSAARIVLSIILLLFGLNKFLHFMSMPELPKSASELMQAFAQSGYIMPMVAIVEILTGILLLCNRYVPLALVLLAPLSVNILLFHLMLDPDGIAAAAVVAVLNIFLLFAYKSSYEAILKPKGSVIRLV